MKYRIYIVEDHDAVREGYVMLLEHEPDLEVCGEAATAETALAEIPAVAPDLVLVDVSLPRMNGIELIRHLHAGEPGLRMLVVSGHEENMYGEGAIRAGAQGYVMKAEEPDVLLRAIRRVLGGGLHFSEALRKKL